MAFIGEFENAVVRLAARDAVDGVLCGHIHSAAVHEKPGAVSYYNCGDFVESCTALVEDFEGRITLLTGFQHPAEAEAAVALIGEEEDGSRTSATGVHPLLRGGATVACKMLRAASATREFTPPWPRNPLSLSQWRVICLISVNLTLAPLRNSAVGVNGLEVPLRSEVALLAEAQFQRLDRP